MNIDYLPWLRLSTVPFLPTKTVIHLLKKSGSAQQILELSLPQLTPFMSQAMAQSLLSFSPAQRLMADRINQWQSINGNYIICMDDNRYPKGFFDLPNPPLLFFYQGILPTSFAPCIAIVGTRNPSKQGLENAYHFAKYLTEQGWIIVSGLALGIDTAAHSGALKAAPNKASATGHLGSQVIKTIAVVGTGLDRVYPKKNLPIAEEILHSGTIISEFPPQTPPLPKNFPIRNRLIAALCKGILIVEASRKSGSIITAQWGLDLGREVMAIPNSIHSPVAKGCHDLIRDGATLVTSVDDILQEITTLKTTPFQTDDKISKINHLATMPPRDFTPSELFQLAAPTTVVEAPLPEALLPEATNQPPASYQQIVLDVLGYDPLHLETLHQRTGLAYPILLSTLVQLELDNLLEILPGPLYQRLTLSK